MKAKLFFNPAAGNPAESAAQLVGLLRHLQAQQIEPEVVLVQPEMRLSAIALNAARAAAKMVIVSGGDGTIENVALGLVGSRTTLGIIPTGSRNNLARSLGIPTDNIAAAVALLRGGRRLKIDVGHVRHRKGSRFFLEAGAVGLASALYPSADDIQHGDLGKIGEFLSTLVSAAPSEIRLRLDHRRTEIVAHAHLVLIANMPFMGANFQIAPDILFDNRRLEVFVYSDLNKRDLIGQAMSQTTAADARIQRFRAKTIEIATQPAMPVMADGVFIGAGSVTVTVRPRSLAVMAGAAAVAGVLT
ncbi:MAG TPA: diacylglycerol kinase family protein [Verrucomicrobiae bacterium]